MIDAYIQARMGSTRLPGKTMFKLGDKTILEHVIDRVKQFNNIRNIVLLTTYKPEDDSLCDVAISNGLLFIRNDPPISRYIEACKIYKPDWFIRVCADSPFMSVELTNKMIEYCRDAGTAQYIAYKDNKYPSIMGLAPEAVLTEPFIKRYASIQEHVTYHMYDHADNFYLQKPKELSENYFRITIDRPEDYAFMQKIWDYFGYVPEWRELQEFIICNCPERIEIEA